MTRRHKSQRMKPSLNVYREARSISEMRTELNVCADLLQDQRTLRKNKAKITNPEECVVPEAGLVVGGWRHESKLLRAAAKREARAQKLAA